jgi:DedD protein
MRDPSRLQERVEVRLERMQLVWVTLGVVVAMGLSFALGLLVGKRAARLAISPAQAAEPLAQVDADGALHHELTFYSRLTSPAPERAAGGRPAPSSPPAPRAAPPTTVAPVAAPLAPATPVAPSEGPPPATTSSPETTLASTAAPSAAASKPSPSPSPSDGASAEVVAELASGPARKGDFTVQVSSFQTADEARAYAASLERKGYKPFVVAGKVKGKGTWYRVRLGAFKDAAHAQGAKNLLARADIPAWILRSE